MRETKPEQNNMEQKNSSLLKAVKDALITAKVGD